MVREHTFEMIAFTHKKTGGLLSLGHNPWQATEKTFPHSAMTFCIPLK